MLQPGEKGVSIARVEEFCNANSIGLLIVTTDTTSGRYPSDSTIMAPSMNSVIMLSHDGHAYVGIVACKETHDVL